MTENMVTILGTNGEFTLARWQVEAAYRYQEVFYTIEDTKRQVDEYLDSYNYSIEYTDKKPIKATEEDYENITAYFLELYGCNIDNNTMWLWVIEKYFGLED